jgi:hypothetical protein
MKSLITKGIALQAQINQVKEEMEEIKESLLPYMTVLADGKQSAKAGVSVGVAEYTQKHELVPTNGKKWEDIKFLLDPDWNRYLKEKIEIKPITGELKELLADGDSVIGAAIRPYIDLKKVDVISFKPN